MRFLKHLELCGDCCLAEVNGEYSQLSEERYEQVRNSFKTWAEENPGVFLSADYDPETGEGITHGEGRCSLCGISGTHESEIWYRFYPANTCGRLRTSI